MEDKVCNIEQSTLEVGSCMKKTRCCRNCSYRRDCEFPCQLSYGEKCKHYKGAVKWRE